MSPRCSAARAVSPRCPHKPPPPLGRWHAFALPWRCYWPLRLCPCNTRPPPPIVSPPRTQQPTHSHSRPHVHMYTCKRGSCGQDGQSCRSAMCKYIKVRPGLGPACPRAMGASRGPQCRRGPGLLTLEQTSTSVATSPLGTASEAQGCPAPECARASAAAPLQHACAALPLQTRTPDP